MSPRSATEWIERDIQQKREKSLASFALLLFKPGFDPSLIWSFQDFCASQALKVLYEFESRLCNSDVIALYPTIFSYSANDLRYGITWKQKTIEYLTSSHCKAFIVEGVAATEKLSKLKNDLRERSGKISTPLAMLSEEEVFERVIKNLVHVVDEAELQNALWIFGPHISADV